ncbi:hypothetical protein KKB55_08920 [Myxococcota bacterium]|nr:hypothetical protein [Myxococcota bacterium]MBU1897863.1 hypothetical protein [Myxococcota bacterium]
MACPAGDAYARLMRAEGAQWVIVAEDDDTLGLCPYIETDLIPGRYVLLINGNGGDVPAYTLSAAIFGACGNGVVEVEEGCDDSNTLFGDGCSAYCQPDLTGGGGVTQWLDVDGRVMVDFQLDAPATVDITNDDDALCRDHDPIMALFQRQGDEWVQLRMDDDSSVGFCSRINIALAAGEYRILQLAPAAQNTEGFNIITFLDVVL